MFERKGLFKIAANKIKDVDEFELEMIDHGLDDLTQDGDQLYLYTSFQDFGKMQKALEERGLEATTTELQFIPTTTKELPDDQAKDVQTLLDLLEEDDDVQSVFHTMH
jgi:transcriptional/translational regulatory protein YebC/TACO1